MTCELEGGALDMAVAIAHGMTVREDGDDANYLHPETLDAWPLGVSSYVRVSEYRPSASWEHGGHIIERDRMYLAHNGEKWEAGTVCEYGHEGPYCKHYGYGPTALIAAMRAFVASKTPNV